MVSLVGRSIGAGECIETAKVDEIEGDCRKKRWGERHLSTRERRCFSARLSLERKLEGWMREVGGGGSLAEGKGRLASNRWGRAGRARRA